LVFVEGCRFDGRGWRVSEIGGDDAVVLEDDGAFRRAARFRHGEDSGVRGGVACRMAEAPLENSRIGGARCLRLRFL